MDNHIKTIRIVLADDHPLVRAGIRAVVEKLPHMEVVGEAGDGREVLILVGKQRPDVVLMDITMPLLNGTLRRNEALDRKIAQDWRHDSCDLLSGKRFTYSPSA